MMGLWRQVTKSMLAACVPPQRMLMRGPRHAPSERPRLALTFDDGPHPSHTPRLLDLLQSHQLKATFFVVGREAERFPDLVRRIAAEGHEIGNHTWSHREPAQTTTRSFLDEVRRTDILLSDLTGMIPLTMRPPKGELNWRELAGLWQMKKTIALWNVDPRDYRMTDSLEATVWSAQYEPRDGDILLLHDNHAWAGAIVESLVTRGSLNEFTSTTLSQMAGRVPHDAATEALAGAR